MYKMPEFITLQIGLLYWWPLCQHINLRTIAENTPFL